MNQSICERSSFVLSFCIFAIFIVYLCLRSPGASAAYIVNTGAADPTATGGLGLSRRCNFIAACSGEWQAGEFTIDSDVVIHSLEGWIGVFSVGPNGGPATAVIYQDGGDIPGAILYSSDFVVPNASGNMVEQDWHGTSGQNWYLEAGTYWAGFEVRPTDGIRSLFGFMGFSGIPNRLERYASISGRLDSGTWDVDLFNRAVGIRIDASVVPLPPAALLFSGSLLLLGAGSKKYSKRA